MITLHFTPLSLIFQIENINVLIFFLTFSSDWSIILILWSILNFLTFFHLNGNFIFKYSTIKCTGFKCVAQWNVTKWTHPFKQLTAQNIEIPNSPLTYLSVTASRFLSGNKQYSDFNHYRLIFPLHELIYVELNSKHLLFFVSGFCKLCLLCVYQEYIVLLCFMVFDCIDILPICYLL